MIPPYIDAELWETYLECRAMFRPKAPFPPRAQKLFLNKLAEFYTAGYDVNHILGESVINSWKSVFVNERTPRRIIAPASAQAILREQSTHTVEPRTPEQIDRLQAARGRASVNALKSVA